MASHRVRCYTQSDEGASRPCHALGPLDGRGTPTPRWLYPYVAQLTLSDAGAVWPEPDESRDEVTAAFEEALTLSGRRILWSWDEARSCIIWVVEGLSRDADPRPSSFA